MTTAAKAVMQHGGPVIAVTASGQFVCSGGEDQTVKLWKIPSGDLLWEGKGHRMGVHAVAISDDNVSFVSGGRDATVRVWDATTGQQSNLFKGAHKSTVNTVAIIEDGSLVVSGSNDTSIVIWDRKSGSVVRQFTGHESPVLALSLADNGRTLLSAEADGKASVWDLGSGTEKASTKPQHFTHIYNVWRHRDGRNMLAWSNAHSEILARNIDDGKEVKFDVVPTPFNAAVGTPAGVVVGATKEGQAVAWNVDSGKQLASLAGGAGEGTCAGQGHFGQYVVTGTDAGNVSLWQLLF